jgi:hypothetical protein
VQPLFENLADVFGMEGDAEALPNEACDAVGGPQFIVPTVRFSSLEQQLLQLFQLSVG